MSTAGDYLRFVEMLRARRRPPTAAGCWARGRSRTWSATTCPGNADLETYGRPLFAETPLRGVGFGLGFSMVHGPGPLRRRGSSLGDYRWGGAASTAFYVDPVEDLTVSFYTQLLPSSTLPIRTYLRAAGQPGPRSTDPPPAPHGCSTRCAPLTVDPGTRDVAAWTRLVGGPVDGADPATRAARPGAGRARPTVATIAGRCCRRSTLPTRRPSQAIGTPPLERGRRLSEPSCAGAARRRAHRHRRPGKRTFSAP